MTLSPCLFSLRPDPLGFAKNLQVTDPTTSTLNVRWEPAEGDVRQYKIIYAPTAGGPETVVGLYISLYRNNINVKCVDHLDPTNSKY